MNQKFFATVLAVLLLGTALINTVSAKVDLKGIDVTLSTSAGDTGDTSLEIDSGDTFYVHTKIKSPDRNETGVDVSLEISVNGVKVYDEDKEIDITENEDYTITVSSDDLSYKDVWDENFMNYYCKSNQKVEVKVSGGVSTETDRADLDITGDRLRISISPENPTADDRIKVTVEDEDNNELEDITVRFTNLGDDDNWDKNDESWDDETDEDGIVTVALSQKSQFDDDPYRMYQLDVWGKGTNYCKYTTTFDARRSLKLGDPSPVNPKAGQQIRIRVISGADKGVSGAGVTVTGPDNYRSIGTTESLGYATITLGNAGNYDVIASRDGYILSEIKRIVVAAKNAVGLSITPKDQEIGRSIIVTATSSNGSALTSARITITKPDGSFESFTMQSDGRITYSPPLTGTYKVRAEEQSHNPTEDEFKAHNSFNLILPEDARINTDLTIIVKNQAGNPVGGAYLSIQSGASFFSGSTNSEGKWTFRVQEPKDYIILVKKEGYADLTKVLTTKGRMSISLSAGEIDLDESVRISIVDDQGNKISTEITATKPDGTKDVTEETYIPKIAGDYEISASKAGYVTVMERLKVNPRPIVLDSRIIGNTLIVQAQSKGKAVSNIAISVKTNAETMKIFTDNEGNAKLDLSNLNVTGSLIVTIEEQNYEKRTILQKFEKSGGIDYPALIGLVVVIVLLIIALISFGRRGKEKGVFKEMPRTTSLHKV